MKILSKLLFGFIALVLLALALVFGCVYMLEKVVPDVAAQRLKAMTGYRLETDSVDLSLMSGSASVKGFHLQNPEGWPEENFVKINEMTIDVDPGTLLGEGRKVIDNLVMDLGTVDIVKNKDGLVNYKDLMEKLGGKEEEAEPEAEETAKEEEVQKEKSAPFEYLIHRLVLRVEKVRFCDYTGSKPSIREVNINLDLTLKEVTNIQDVVAQVMMHSGASLMNLLSSVKMNLGGDSSNDEDDSDKGGSFAAPVKESVKGMFDSLKNKIKGDED